MGQAGIGEKLARRAVLLVMDQDSPRQDAERAFDHAHVLVQHHVMDIGAVEQRADRRNQHDVVGPNQFPQIRALPFTTRWRQALAATSSTFYCEFPGYQSWRPAWRLWYLSRTPRARRSSPW